MVTRYYFVSNGGLEKLADRGRVRELLVWADGHACTMQGRSASSSNAVPVRGWKCMDFAAAAAATYIDSAAAHCRRLLS